MIVQLEVYKLVISIAKRYVLVWSSAYHNVLMYIQLLFFGTN